MGNSRPLPKGGLMLGFVGNATWFGILLGFHVAGAIIGLGPAFAFSIIGPAIGKQENPAGSLALMKVMESIEKGMILPILGIVQLGSGIGLIFNRSLDVDFFGSHNRWLLGGILLYALALGLSIGIDAPAMGKLVHKAEKGEIDEEFGRLVKVTKTLGPVLSVLSVGIIILMVWKPGSGCGALLRC
jgi:hypothetical protein